MATIIEVAKAARVSRSTVSRVLNNEENVRQATRQRVLETMRKLDYSPNNAARSLAKKQTHAIGVVVNNLHDPFFHDLIKGFEAGASETSYNVVFCSAFGGDPAGKERYVRYLTNGVTDGIILYGSYLSDEPIIRSLVDSKAQFVLIENDVMGDKTNNLLIDNLGGAEKAVDYLYAQGHRHIAHISGNPNKKVTVDRFNGYLRAMHKNALEIHQGYIQHTTTNYTSGYDMMQRLLALEENRPTAVFCSDDAIASYAIRAALDAGFSIPGDISIMGFDNQKILPDGYAGPSITTMIQPLYQIGFDSIRLLTSILENEPSERKLSERYDVSVLVRDTVGAPRMWSEAMKTCLKEEVH